MIDIKQDGYINLTALCKSGKKEFSHWKENKKTKIFLQYLSSKLDKPIDKLLIYQGGAIGERSTWGHPLIATNISSWISSEFAVDVSFWIEEWRMINNNDEIYKTKINNLTPDSNNTVEKEIKFRLQKELGGLIEVETIDGFIDLLTDTEIIEIKTGENWKHALGQILVYSTYYPDHTKRIHLFDIKPDENIESMCNKFNVSISYE